MILSYIGRTYVCCLLDIVEHKYKQIGMWSPILGEHNRSLHFSPNVGEHTSSLFNFPHIKENHRMIISFRLAVLLIMLPTFEASKSHDQKRKNFLVLFKACKGKAPGDACSHKVCETHRFFTIIRKTCNEIHDKCRLCGKMLFCKDFGNCQQ